MTELRPALQVRSGVEELHNRLAAAIGDLQRLNGKLLLRLDCGQPGGGFLHVRVDKAAYTSGAVDRTSEIQPSERRATEELAA